MTSEDEDVLLNTLHPTAPGSLVWLDCSFKSGSHSIDLWCVMLVTGSTAADLKGALSNLWLLSPSFGKQGNTTIQQQASVQLIIVFNML